MKVVIYSEGFVPPDEFIEFMLDHYYVNLNDPSFVRKKETVEFIEARLVGPHKVYPGREDHRYRVGHAGFAQVVDVDPNKTWRLRDNYSVCIGYQEVEYVNVNIDSNGYLTVTKRK